MGAGASHVETILKDVKNPLQITDKMNSSLDIVSLIVTRILSTPDIYDLKNLKKEGVCGDYIVVLKEKLMASMALMPYYTASGEEVLYQAPDKLIQNPATRKRICKEIAESALTIVAIVVSCLASIQVSTKKREQIVVDTLPKTTTPLTAAPLATPLAAQPTPIPSVYTPTPSVFQPTPTVYAPRVYPQTPTVYAPRVYPQTPAVYAPRVYAQPTPPFQYPYVMQGGGFDQAVVDWLIQHQYVQAKGTQQYEFVDRSVPKTQSFVLNMENSSTLYRDITPGLTADVQFVSIESSPEFRSLHGRSVILQCLPPITMPTSAREHILPIRVLDATGLAYFSGVLYNGMFRSFTEGKHEMFDIPTLLFLMFRISRQDITPGLKESAMRILDTADQRRQNNLTFEKGKYDPNAIVARISSYLVGSTPSFQSPIPYFPAKTTTQEYSIPASSAFSILQTLDTYKTKLALDSCPAMIRSKSLLDEITESRRARTKFCSDIYWSQPNLGKIYPYTTLQFLCIKDWSSPNLLEASFTTFCDNYVKLYNDAAGFAPKLFSPTAQKDISGVQTQAQFGRLDSMRFDSASYESFKKEFCSAGPIVSEPKDITPILQELNAEFKQHITSVLAIIDSLIIVIKDPDTGSYVARLSPEITSRKRSTKEFILKQKEAAIARISSHYLRVEELYLRGIKATLQNRVLALSSSGPNPKLTPPAQGV